MPNRTKLLHLLKEYEYYNDDDQKKLSNTITQFVSSNTSCFLRENQNGHVTGSCWILDPKEKDVLLTHHKKIGDWLQLGGHADGDGNILRVALREAEEESGIKGIIALDEKIFDVDIHRILKHKHIAEHYHYDIRFIFKAPHRNFYVSNESHALAWVPIIALLNAKNPSLRRMAQKWLRNK
jgi:8-oxo-dGTP pyrophosphatase MutT (NUDIX family)